MKYLLGFFRKRKLIRKLEHDIVIYSWDRNVKDFVVENMCKRLTRLRNL